MNRTIWIWRFIAIAILLICAILLMNLYTRLTSMSSEQPVRVEQVEQGEGETESHRIDASDAETDRRGD